MEHIYREHYKRNVISLNGDWLFAIDPKKVGRDEKWFENFPADHRHLNVPGCWNTQALDLFGYIGVAWYKKEFVCNACTLKLEFGAVLNDSEVYLDGQLLGSHYGGWSAFSFTADVEAGTHTVVVRTDSAPNRSNTIPMQDADWYHYGGIIRSVEISEFHHAYIDSHRISYELNDDLTAADVTVAFAVKGASGEIPVEVKIDDDTVFNAAAKIVDGKVEIKGIHLDNIKLWGVGEPNLYTVHILLPEDDLVEKIGFREIKVQDMKFFLNRKEIFFKGVNRHEEHADWGFAVPANINRRDIEIIKNLNCNMVRGAHYPQSQTWVDYLDREGILFWSEIPMWGALYNDVTTVDPVLIKRGLDMHREMVEQYYHHPSIIVWGMHNEIKTELPEVYEMTRQFTELVRGMDSSRLITYACNRYPADICLDLVDFISLNYYMGWYAGTLNDWKGFIEGARKIAEEKGVGDKPIVMSEFGCAALYGYSNFSGDKWTMQYQCDMIKTIIDLSVATDGFCGTLVWQYADIKSAKEINRARHFNNKGLVDEFRRPKMSYYMVKDLFKNIP